MVPPIVGRSHDDFGRRWAGWDSVSGAGGDLKLTLTLSPPNGSLIFAFSNLNPSYR